MQGIGPQAAQHRKTYVGDREDGDVELLAVLVDHALRVDGHSRRALVQDSELGLHQVSNALTPLRKVLRQTL